MGRGLAIFPSQISPQYQGRVTGLKFGILDGEGTFQVELQDPAGVIIPVGSAPLSGDQQTVQFELPVLEAIQNLNWVVKGNSGNFVVVDQVELIVELPQLDVGQRAFLWSYAMLLSNWNSTSGLTRDRANFPEGDFDNVSASGLQAAAAVMALDLGFITDTQIVTDTTTALLNLPSWCHGLWPHFVTDGQITSDTEWSSLDTVIAAIALIEAREALGLDTSEVEQVLKGIDWEVLILPDGTISHGYNHDCSQRIDNGWYDFGTESWLVNFGYAAATGNTAEMDSTPPTFNGSGFIDELAWLLIPAPERDRWGIEWWIYREQAADDQLDYYQIHPCYGQYGLFGLSAAEIPDPSAVPLLQIYQPFGMGGEILPNDGTNLLGHAVVVPHYAAMIASLRPDEASHLWRWIEIIGLFTPLNNVESFMFIDEPDCEQVVWNALKGSWNLSLQTLGWGRRLAGENNFLFNAMWTNNLLRKGYLIMEGTGTLEGMVDVQGRSDESGAEVCAWQGGAEFECTSTNATGYYSFSLPANTYDVIVEMARYLDAEKTDVSVVAGGTTTLCQVKVLGGDANDDDVINILDLSFIGYRFGACVGDSLYDERADINNDGCINILDLVGAGANFNKTSPVPWPCS
jgi:hypothetical protein